MKYELKENIEYARIGEELIREEEIFDHIRGNDIQIRYLESNKPMPKKGRVILGECRKLSDKTKDILEAIGVEDTTVPDFVIIIYKERIIGFTEEQLRILIMHELMHIGVKKNNDNGEGTYCIVKHDLEDFRYIVDQYGPHWNEDRSQLTMQQFLADPETGEIREAV